MKAVEASAKTREEAIQSALKQLGVEMYEVDKIEIIDEGSKGILGFGARPVRVRLIVENMPDEPQRPAASERPRRESGRPERGERSDRGDRNDRSDRNRGDRNQNRDKSEAREKNESREGQGNRDNQNNRGGRGEKSGGERNNRDGGRDGNRNKPRENQQASGVEREGQQPRGEREGQQPRGEGEGRGRGRGRGRGDRSEKPADQQSRGERPQRGERPERKENRGERPERGERPPRGERPERKERPERPERPERKERPVAALAEGEQVADDFVEQQENAGVDTTAPITDEQGVEAAGLLEQIIARMGIAGTAAFVRSDDGSARINVSSEDSAILIGRKGRNLSAMQYLINRMISRGDTNENTERIVVDVEGYVDRRRESLEELARSMANRAKETQRNMRLKPLSPQERRIIHLTLQGDEEIRTFSLGDSLFRSVVISPKNAARPERAPRSSRGNRGGRRRGGRGRSGGGDYAGRNEGGDIDVGALSD